MSLDDVEVLGGPLVLATVQQVNEVAEQVWVRFPDGYTEYVTTLGEGTLGGTFVRIHPPWRIAAELEMWRERVRKYWLWDGGKKVLPKARGVECVIIGDTVGGDELIVHPGRPERLFVLPRGSSRIHEAGADVLSAVEWMCSSGTLTKPFTDRRFEPFDSRTWKRAKTQKDVPVESLQSAIDDIIAWGKKLKLAKLAEERCVGQVKEFEATFGFKPEELKFKLKKQSLVVVPEKYRTQAIATDIAIHRRDNGYEVAVFTLFTDIDTAESNVSCFQDVRRA